MTSTPSQLPFPLEGVLLHELNHRISNEFCSAISIATRAAARSGNKEVKAALIDVVDILHHYAEVHHALQMPEHGIRTDAAAYLRKLCLSIRRSKLSQMKIDLVLAARRLWLQPNRCWLLGMIVYELITNAARHAFVGGNGWIRVELLRADAFVECRVLDNGSAPESFQPGGGLKIVHELTKALGGRFDQRFTTGGSMSIVAFPSSVGPPRKRKTRHRMSLACGGTGSVLDQSLQFPQSSKSRKQSEGEAMNLAELKSVAEAKVSLERGTFAAEESSRHQRTFRHPLGEINSR